MARIYLIRHGESIANTLGIYQGQTFDTDLSPLGYRQVSALHDFFMDKKIFAIYTSPLMRTRKTAEQVALATNVRIELDNRLLETNHGAWEGLPKNEIEVRWGDILKQWSINPFGVGFPGGETFEMLQNRIIEWFKVAVKAEVDTVFVTHDNVIRVVVAYINNLPTNKFWDYPLDPAGVTTIEINDNLPKLLKLNENNHLQDCLTNLALHAL